MRSTARVLAALAAALLAACETVAPQDGAGAPTADAEPAGESPAEPATGRTASAAPSIADLLPEPGARTAAARPAPDAPAPASAPHVYLALQPAGPGHPVSVVFAIDAARDGTPSDDPAIRLTPEAGRCNPQEMRRYAFPPETAPAVSEAEAARGLSARDLPRFLAAEVTGRMIEAGLAGEPEDTRALNVCTRKLWERLVVAENRDRRAAGQ